MLSATLGAGGMVPTPGTPATNATMAYATLSLLGDTKIQNDQKVCTGKTLESRVLRQNLSLMLWGHCRSSEHGLSNLHKQLKM